MSGVPRDSSLLLNQPRFEEKTVIFGFPSRDLYAFRVHLLDIENWSRKSHLKPQQSLELASSGVSDSVRPSLPPQPFGALYVPSEPTLVFWCLHGFTGLLAVKNEDIVRENGDPTNPACGFMVGLGGTKCPFAVVRRVTIEPWPTQNSKSGTAVIIVPFAGSFGIVPSNNQLNYLICNWVCRFLTR